MNRRRRHTPTKYPTYSSAKRASEKSRARKGAIKLHTVLTEMLPQCVLVTDGKTHDRRAIQDLHFEPDDLLIFDRAYLDYAGFTACTKTASGS